MVRPEPESPCIRACTLDEETNICVGCFRTLDEIAGWSRYSAENKLAVLEKIRIRKREYAQKLGSSWPARRDPD